MQGMLHQKKEQMDINHTQEGIGHSQNPVGLSYCNDEAHAR
jgi:hypothetical protein